MATAISNIKEYIDENHRLNRLDFVTVYVTIVELIRDGKLEYTLHDKSEGENV